jgi:hypothetical protein
MINKVCIVGEKNFDIVETHGTTTKMFVHVMAFSYVYF